MTILPDGRILIGEKGGVIWVYKNGAVLPDPFANIANHVNNYWDRGFVGITPDKNFATNGFVYLLYTYENNAAKIDDPKTGRLTRVTMVGDQASPNAGSPAERVVLGMSVGAGMQRLDLGLGPGRPAAPARPARRPRRAGPERPGVEQAEIVEILDHHHIGSIETRIPVTATFDPVGSTATLVIERFRQSGMEPSRPTAMMLLGAVMSDTIILNSADHHRPRPPRWSTTSSACSCSTRSSAARCSRPPPTSRR